MGKTFSKILSMVLAVSMLGAMSTSVFAEENTLGEGQNEDESEVQELIARLEQAKEHIPIDFSLDDMKTFLEKADPDTVERIMSDIADHAPPAPDFIYESSAKQNNQQRSNQYLSYDFRTKVEQVLTFDDSDDNTIIQEFSGNPIGDAAPMPTERAYPDYWFEESPQSYYDTRTNVDLLIKSKDGIFFNGSGFLVSDDTLVTAAHNIFGNGNDNNLNGWCDYLTINPSHCESAGNPYGYAFSTTVHIGNYKDTGYRGDDWGIAKMDRAFSIGSLGMTANSSNEKGREVRIQGYPSYRDSSGNPSDLPSPHGNGNLFLATGRITKDESSYLKRCSATSYKGMSGGPVMYKDSNNNWVAGGIISGGSPYGGESIFCAFDNNLYNLIRSYI